MTARAITRRFAASSDVAGFVYMMLGFVGLLNRFPQDIVAQAAEDHRRLTETFELSFTTLEDLAAQKRQNQ